MVRYVTKFEGMGDYLPITDWKASHYLIHPNGIQLFDSETSCKNAADALGVRYYRYPEEPGHFEKGKWVNDYPTKLWK